MDNKPSASLRILLVLSLVSAFLLTVEILLIILSYFGLNSFLSDNFQVMFAFGLFLIPPPALVFGILSIVFGKIAERKESGVAQKSYIQWNLKVGIYVIVVAILFIIFGIASINALNAVRF